MENFKLKNFYHLLDLNFYIPSFQRGYRWEKKHIENLLDDLKEFHLNKKTSNFYCLQPIVVKKRVNEENSYDILDGQQRLTTIYLILTYLEEVVKEHIIETPKLFSLHFEMREEKEEDYKGKKFINVDEDDKNYIQNIDYFYIRKAYEVIDSWFNANRQSKLEIAKLLAAPPQNGNDEEHKDVRVIWYEISTSEDSIEVFSRLNYGKIGLTETELIKALVLQSDIYGDEKKYMSQWTLKVASDWDRIERDLHEPNFWAMLVTDKQQKASENTLVSRISLILEFVAKNHLSVFDQKLQCYRYIYDSQDDDKKQNRIKPSKYNTRYVYDVINKYLSEKGDCNLEFKKRVENLWEHVLNTFSILKNWYEDYEIFHLLGLLRLLKIEDEEFLLHLFVNYKGKESFKENLRNAIGAEVKIKSKSKDNNGLDRVNSLKTINYIDNDKEIIKILELFNVHLIIKSKQDGTRFNFAKFREQNVTSLEHIHPQHLDEETLSFDDIIGWINDKKNDLGNCEELSADFEYFDKSFDKEKYKTDRETWMKHIHNIDKKCDDLAEMDEAIMHSIKNMALIDKDTNAALQNYLLDKKRNKLKERSAQGIYIPIGTWHVFNKFFSENVSELKFWTTKDREAYFNKIKEIYNEYVK